MSGWFALYFVLGLFVLAIISAYVVPNKWFSDNEHDKKH